MSALDIARDLLRRGIVPVPVPHGEKGPRIMEWQKLDITEENVEQHFNGGPLNVGMQLGPKSGGLADVDLDSKEAIALASYFLPHTDSKYGHASKRASHWLYTVSDPDPRGEYKFIDENNDTIIELRLGGGGKAIQSIAPGSLHPSGELYEWDSDGERTLVGCKDLLRAIKKIAVGSIIARHWPEENRHDTAMTVGGVLARAGWSEDEVGEFVVAVQEVAGVRHRSHVENGRLAAVESVESVAKGSKAWGLPEFVKYFGKERADKVAGWLDYDREDRAALSSVRASSVIMTAIEWLWPGRFAVGKLGIVAGLPDEGKSMVLSYVAAAITGEANKWPCNEGRAPRGEVIMLTCEDDLSDTLVPRLKAAGADLGAVEIVKMVNVDGSKERMFSLVSDLDLLRRRIVELGDVKAVMIDPISAYLGVKKIDSFRTTDVRAVLAPLVQLASELRVAIIGIMHFNKNDDVTNALLRISDSLAFTATARHVYCVVADKENNRKLMVRGRNAITSKDQSLAFSFSSKEVGRDPRTNETIWGSYVVWEEQYVDVTAAEAMAAAKENRSPTARDDARKFLQAKLAGGPISADEIVEEAKAEMISERTLNRAKKGLGVISEKGATGWTWRLPEKPEPGSKHPF